MSFKSCLFFRGLWERWKSCIYLGKAHCDTFGASPRDCHIKWNNYWNINMCVKQPHDCFPFKLYTSLFMIPFIVVAVVNTEHFCFMWMFDCLYVCIPCTCSVGHSRWELQAPCITDCCNLQCGCGNWTWILSKSIECSCTLSLLSRPIVFRLLLFMSKMKPLLTNVALTIVISFPYSKTL